MKTCEDCKYYETCKLHVNNFPPTEFCEEFEEKQ